MLISASILILVFGVIAFINLMKYIIGNGINNAEACLLVISVIISSLAAGVIWGGLFSQFY